MNYNRWIADDGRHCTRCGAAVHAPDPPHLCKDLAERYERQAKAVETVRTVFRQRRIDDFIDNEEIEIEAALDIIKALAGRDLGLG